MKRNLPALLLLVLGAAAAAQPANRTQLAMSVRAQESLDVSNARQAAHYAENRKRCEAALRIAKLCGKYAGKFSCDEKGFKEIPADVTIRPIVMDYAATYKMERCAQDAAKGGP